MRVDAHGAGSEPDGVLERATDEVAEQGARAVSFVGRLGSAFGAGLRDARDAGGGAEQDPPRP
jgi:hypothetical protein